MQPIQLHSTYFWAFHFVALMELTASSLAEPNFRKRGNSQKLQSFGIKRI
jgi:hypothetical protein